MMYVVVYNNVVKRIAEVMLCSILSDRLSVVVNLV
jgi:HD superfamily phosphohydrolase